VRTASVVAVILVAVGYANIADLLGDGTPPDPRTPKITRAQFDSLAYGTPRSEVEGRLGRATQRERPALGCWVYDGYGEDSLANLAGLEVCYGTGGGLVRKCAEWADSYGNPYYQCKAAEGRPS
jgi:hypothetical protein